MHSARTYARRLPLVATLAIAGLALSLPATATAASKANAGTGGADDRVRVMTRNLYLGADLTPALAATNTTELALAASTILETVRRTDFPERAKLIAQEIKRSRAHLVGLQEGALYRADRDGEPDGPLTPATEPLYNFRGILMRALRRIGAPYRVVQVQREADIEVPTAGGFDVRLTMRDMILARDGVNVPKGNGENFATNLVIEDAGGVPGLDITVHRGWNMVQANVNGNQLRVVNTHLEAFHPGIRQAQAAELVADPGPATARRPMILLGDLNSDDDSVAGPNTLAYQTLLGAGLVERTGNEPTFGYGETLDDASETFFEQIDHVMVNDPDIELVRSYVTGNNLKMRTPPTGPGVVPSHGRLWPSDHGGVVSVLSLP